MCSTLSINNLGTALHQSEREDLLKHYGAKEVWFDSDEHNNIAYASFTSPLEAEKALINLHQMEICGKRLIVLYATDLRHKRLEESLNNDSLSRNSGIDHLLASVNLNQPPHRCLNYKYPSAEPQFVLNIACELYTNISFYVQTLHLMNKMDLDHPFHSVHKSAKTLFEACLLDIGNELHPTQLIKETSNKLSSDESEISDNEDPNNICYEIPLKKKKVSTKTLNTDLLNLRRYKSYDETKKQQKMETTTASRETRKIVVNVNKTQLVPAQETAVEVIGSIGKMIDTKSNIDSTIVDESSQLKDSHPDLGIITSKELSGNRISSDDMKCLPIFKNYHPGIPSLRLYIKNLSKDVGNSDIERIYRRYLVKCNTEEKNMFDIKVLQEGRMKGQAFVSLPSTELSKQALEETNGFILKDKPMCVQFARTSK